ncbi:MAG: CYTH domain-containing protein [Gammaproteobacteria bacterium]|nr:CYTH domain-containing protein [Gammaproteobacteria bacterium]
MAIEIERKYLILNEDWRASVTHAAQYRQGYLTQSGPASVRVRIEGRRAFINIKSATLGISRTEFEYEIPLLDADHLLSHLCIGPTIEKTRYFVPFGGKTWEIDVFSGENAGLVIAEVELSDAQEAIALPPWAGAEVSDDPRYYNVSLVQHPYCSWQR